MQSRKSSSEREIERHLHALAEAEVLTLELIIVAIWNKPWLLDRLMGVEVACREAAEQFLLVRRVPPDIADEAATNATTRILWLDRAEGRDRKPLHVVAQEEAWKIQRERGFPRGFGKRQPFEEGEQAEPVPASEGTNEHAKVRVNEHVAHVMHRLKRETRRILEEYVINGKSSTEVAGMTEKSPIGVRVCVWRALKHLRRELEEVARPELVALGILK